MGMDVESWCDHHENKVGMWGSDVWYVVRMLRTSENKQTLCAWLQKNSLRSFRRSRNQSTINQRNNESTLRTVRLHLINNHHHSLDLMFAVFAVYCCWRDVYVELDHRKYHRAIPTAATFHAPHHNKRNTKKIEDHAAERERGQERRPTPAHTTTKQKQKHTENPKTSTIIRSVRGQLVVQHSSIYNKLREASMA